jgi:hypothetical protein
MKTKGLSSYKLKKVKDNLLHFYNEVKDDQDLVSQGESWYLQANIWCEKLAVNYGISTYKVASVLSALSPRNNWERNKQDAEAVIQTWRKGGSPDDVTVCTFTSNKQKAFDILNSVAEIEPKSLKTRAFLLNIAYLDPEAVTIDVWHLRACFDRMIVPKSLTPTIYKQLQDLTIKLAKERGLRGYEFQAIVWGAVRGSL